MEVCMDVHMNVLLVCGSGASTAFMAANIRKAAKKEGIPISVEARSETEIENFTDQVNCIMLGPHLDYLLDEITQRYKDRDIKIAVMKKCYYSILDGEAAINHIKSLF
jgi:PTS system cellobiose-specific IIB component